MARLVQEITDGEGGQACWGKHTDEWKDKLQSKIIKKKGKKRVETHRAEIKASNDEVNGNFIVCALHHVRSRLQSYELVTQIEFYIIHF